jgi:hypothetical protein
MYNHSSGETSPSDPDTRVTSDLIRTRQLLKMEVTDRTAFGNHQHKLLKGLGQFNVQPKPDRQSFVGLLKWLCSCRHAANYVGHLLSLCGIRHLT